MRSATGFEDCVSWREETDPRVVLLFAGARFALVARGLTEKMLRILKLRYTDAPSSPLPDKHFGVKL